MWRSIITRLPAGARAAVKQRIAARGYGACTRTLRNALYRIITLARQAT